MIRITRQEALEFLNYRRENNIPYINFIEYNQVSAYYQCGSSLLFRGTSDKNWIYICSDDPDELEDLVGALTDQDRNFALVQSWMLPLIAPNREPSWQLKSLKLALPLTAPLPTPDTKPVMLEPGDAEGIYASWPYAHYTTLEYTRDRIARGNSAGIFDKGIPVAWAITHDDGAIGFLYVRQGYRGRGYAMAVTLEVARQLRLQDKPAHVNIEPDNSKSLALAEKLGFIHKGEVMWVGY